MQLCCWNRWPTGTRFGWQSCPVPPNPASSFTHAFAFVKLETEATVRLENPVLILKENPVRHVLRDDVDPEAAGDARLLDLVAKGILADGGGARAGDGWNCEDARSQDAQIFGGRFFHGKGLSVWLARWRFEQESRIERSRVSRRGDRANSRKFVSVAGVQKFQRGRLGVRRGNKLVLLAHGLLDGDAVAFAVDAAHAGLRMGLHKLAQPKPGKAGTPSNLQRRC